MNSKYRNSIIFLTFVFSTSIIFCNDDSYNLYKYINDRRTEFFDVFNVDINYDDLDIEMDNDCLKDSNYSSFERGFKKAIKFSRDREFYKNDALLAIELPEKYGEEIECELQEWFGSKRIDDFAYHQVFYRSLFSITGELGGEVNEVYAALDPSVKRMMEAKLEWYLEEAEKRMQYAARKANDIKNSIKRGEVQAKIEKAMNDMTDSVKNRKKMEDTTINLERNIRVILGDIVYFYEPLLEDVQFAHHWNVKFDKTYSELTEK